MRSSTLSETLTGVQLGEDESLYGPQITVAGDVADEAPSGPEEHHAARGVLTGILLGVGAWGAIWVAASALWHYRG